MCYSPLIAIRDHSSSVSAADGSKYHPIKIFSRSQVMPSYCKDVRDWRDQVVAANPRRFEALDLCCGQCLACRMKNAKEWQTRLVAESTTSDNALFITFTYDDEHLPHSELGFPTLCYEDIRDFNKSLTRVLDRRFALPSPRHFFALEYGSLTQRPHAHSIHFNLPREILGLTHQFYNSQGLEFFRSSLLDEVWGRGFVVVGDFSPQAAGYVARYVTKKLNGPAQDERFNKFGMLPEKNFVSNRPGIGSEWALAHKVDIRQFDKVTLPGIEAVPVPSYFDRILGDVEDLARIKVERSTKAQMAVNHILDVNNITIDQYLKSQEIKIKNICKKLPREGI